MDETTRAPQFDRVSAVPFKENGVALCFKVPLRFRQWFKLQALSRNLTMTEFLVKAAESYSSVDCENARDCFKTDLRK
jgi:hypothetical protein